MTEPRGYDPEGEPWYDDGVTPPGGRWAIWDYEGRKWDPLPADYDPGKQARADLAAAIVAAVEGLQPTGTLGRGPTRRSAIGMAEMRRAVLAAIREASE